MRRKIIIASFTCLLIAAIDIVVAQPGAGKKEAATVVFPKTDADALLWPTSNSFVWTINHFDESSKGKNVAVVVRLNRERLDHSTVSAAPDVTTKEQTEKELSFGSLSPIKQGDVARVSVQLIDFDDVALPVGKQPLRLLVSLSARGATAYRKGAESILDGDRLTGRVFNPDLTWKDGELFLQRLYVRVGEKYAYYDVVVVKK